MLWWTLWGLLCWVLQIRARPPLHTKNIQFTASFWGIHNDDGNWPTIANLPPPIAPGLDYIGCYWYRRDWNATWFYRPEDEDNWWDFPVRVNRHCTLYVPLFDETRFGKYTCVVLLPRHDRPRIIQTVTIGYWPKRKRRHTEL